MDDIVKHNKERLAQKEAVRQYREELNAQKSKRQYKPAYYQGYNASLGKHQIQTLGDSTTSANRIITNGAIPRGLAVNFADGFLDGMPRVKATITAISATKTKNIKYVLVKTVSGITSIYICGWQAVCKKIVDLPSDIINDGVYGVPIVVDNLGSNNYIVSLYYRKINGDTVFQAYNQNGLINEYIESGLSVFNVLFATWPTTAVATGFYSGIYGNRFFYPVGFGRFVANYCHDSSTVDGVLPSGVPSSGSTTGRVRMVVDLLKEPTVTKYVHPAQIGTRTGSTGSTVIYTDQWLGLNVFGSLNNTIPSFINGYLSSGNTAGDTVINSSSETRYLLRTSENGDIGIGETLKDKNQTGGEFYENYYIAVNDSLNDSLYPLQVTGSSDPVNRFALSLSTLLGRGANCIDITQTGFYFIENQNANASMVPPIPSTTLYQIERKTSTQQVTVQKLNLQFEKSSSVTVKVYPPDVNATETSNFGIVVAASYG